MLLHDLAGMQAKNNHTPQLVHMQWLGMSIQIFELDIVQQMQYFQGCLLLR